MREVLNEKPERSRDPAYAAGPPEEIVREKRSYTAACLKPVLARRGAAEKKKRVEAAE